MAHKMQNRRSQRKQSDEMPLILETAREREESSEGGGLFLGNFAVRCSSETDAPPDGSQEDSSAAIDLQGSDFGPSDEKYQKKIKLMEKNMAQIQKDHALSIEGLHKEIERLSGLVSEMMLSIASGGNEEVLLGLGKAEGLLVSQEPKKPTTPQSQDKSSILSSLKKSNPPRVRVQAPPPKPEVTDQQIQTDPVAKQRKIVKVDRGTETNQIVLLSEECQTEEPKVAASLLVVNLPPPPPSALPAPPPQIQPKEAISEVSLRAEDLARDGLAKGTSITKIESLDLPPTSAHDQQDKDTLHDARKSLVTPESIYLLVQREKKKFHAYVERVSEEKKRKQLQIDQLRQEMHILKQVLKMAGLDMGVHDFKEILNAYPQTKGLQHKSLLFPPPPSVITNGPVPQDSKESTFIAEKTPVLPPISSVHPFDDEFEDDVHATIKELQAAQPEEKTQVERDEYDESSIGQERNENANAATLQDFQYAPPPTTDRDSNGTNPRKNRYKVTLSVPPAAVPNFASDVPVTPLIAKLSQEPTQIPALLQHNQNLDYNNRAHLYLDGVVYESVAVAPLEVGMIPNVSSLNQSETELSKVFSKLREKELPPLKEVVGPGEVLVDPASKKTSYAGRMWRSKIVRSNQVKSLQKKF